MLVREALEKLNGEHTVLTLGKEVQVGEKKMAAMLNFVGIVFEGSEWAFKGDESTLDTQMSDYKDKVTAKGKPKNEKNQLRNTKVQSSTTLKQNVKTSTPTHSDFTGYEIDVLKSIVEERKRNIELFTEYRVYEELSKVPVGVDQVRSAFNMSKETTERLKKYASVRRIPLQDIVELAVIKLLDQYDK